MSGFRRLVLELNHTDQVTMREAAAYAGLLGVELQALFVEDETLLHASALPFAREINPVSLRWRKMEPDRLEAEFRATAEQARTRLMAVANAVGIRRSFEIRRGDRVSQITEFCVATDIVVMASSRPDVPRLHETTDQSAASVLYLPPGAGRRRGPIVVVANGDDDPALRAARVIAAQKQESLVVVGDAGDIAAVLGYSRERLIVMARGHGDGRELAAARGAAVLVVADPA